MPLIKTVIRVIFWPPKASVLLLCSSIHQNNRCLVDPNEPKYKNTSMAMNFMLEDY